MSTRCVSRLCPEEDTVHHAKQCQFMYTKWEDKFEEDDKMKAVYLVRLNRERRRRFNMPIL